MISFLDLLIYENANIYDYAYQYDDSSFKNQRNFDTKQLEVTIRKRNVMEARQEINNLNIEKNSFINGISSAIYDVYAEFFIQLQFQGGFGN